MDELLRKRVSEIDTTAICDADKTTRVMSASLKHRSANPFVCAPAYTVRCRDDFFAVLDAVESAPPGSVVVVDGGGKELALAGELFARAALARGLAGIIVDGGYRDISYVSQCELPVFSRHVTPMAGTTTRLGESQVAVTCGGVTVKPGDVVIADREGIVVLDPQQLQSIVEKAEAVKEVEGRATALLETGKSLVDCLNVDEHRSQLQRGESSSLRFTI